MENTHSEYLRKAERRKIDAQVQTKVAMRRDEKREREAARLAAAALKAKMAAAAGEEVMDDEGNVTKIKPKQIKAIGAKANSKRQRALRRMYRELGEEDKLVDEEEEKKKKKKASKKAPKEQSEEIEQGGEPSEPNLSAVAPLKQKFSQVHLQNAANGTVKANIKPASAPKQSKDTSAPKAPSSPDPAVKVDNSKAGSGSAGSEGGKKPFGVVFTPYAGDAFGTRGNYVEGMVYQSRLMRSKKKRTGILAQFFDAGKTFAPETEDDIDDTISILSTDVGSKQRCAATLFNLSKFPTNVKGMIAEGGVNALITLGKSDDPLASVMVAGAFANLTLDPDACERIVSDGATETIVALSHSDESEVRRYSCKAVFNLTRMKGREATIVQQGVLGSMIRLRQESFECSFACSVAIYNLSCVNSSYLRMEKVVQTTITIINNVMDSVSDNGWSSSRSGSEKKVDLLKPCVQALKNYSNIESFRARLMEEGALHALHMLLKTRNTEIIELSSAVLYDLSTSDRNRAPMVREKTVPVLLEMVKYPSEVIKQNCGGTLSQLALNEANQIYVITQGLPILLGLAKSKTYKTLITCARTLTVLSGNRRGCARLIKAGAIEVLIGMIKEDKELGASPLKRSIVSALGNMLGHDAVADETLRGVVPILVKLCRLDDSFICEECTLVLYRVSCIAHNLPAMAESAAIEVILEMLSICNLDDDSSLQRTCVSTICNISSADPAQLVRIKDAGAIPLLLRFVNSANQQTQEDCAQSLCSLAEEPVCAKEIVREGLKNLILLADGDNIVTKHWCGAILCSLSFDDSTRIAQVNAGVKDALITLSNLKDHAMAQRCATAFCNLTCNPSAADKLADVDTIKTLLGLGGAYSEHTRASCARALCNLSSRPGVEKLMVESRAVPELMVMALVRSESRMTKRICAKTLMNILVESTMEKMFEFGVVWAISSLAKIELGEGKSHDEGMIRACATAFHNISCNEIGKTRILSDKLALQAIFFFLYEGTHQVKDACWKTLWNIITSARRHVDLIDAGLLHWLEALAVDAQSQGINRTRKNNGLDNDLAGDIDLNDHVLTMIFNLIDADNSRTLEKQELIEAVNDNQQVLELLHTSKLLKPLLKPELYQEAFLHLETANDGHVTYAEFKSFILTVVTAAAKKEERDDRRRKRKRERNQSDADGAFDSKYDDNSEDKGSEEKQKIWEEFSSQAVHVLHRAAMDNLRVCLRSSATKKLLMTLGHETNISEENCHHVEFNASTVPGKDENNVFGCWLGTEDGSISFQNSHLSYLSALQKDDEVSLGSSWTIGDSETFEIISGEKHEGNVVHFYNKSLDKFISCVHPSGFCTSMGRDTAFEVLTPGWDYQEMVQEAGKHAQQAMLNCAKAMKALAVNTQNCERLVTEGGMSILVALSRAESVKTKEIIAEVVAILAQHPVTREMIVAEGAMATMEMLTKTQNMKILSLCARTLYMLSLCAESAPVLIQQGLIPVVEEIIHACIQDGSAEGKKICMYVLQTVEFISRVEAVRLRMIAEEIIPAMLDALEVVGEKAHLTVVVCLTNFAVLRRARKALVTGGATGALVQISSSTNDADMIQRVALVLSYLASVNNGAMRQAMMYSGVMEALVKISKSDRIPSKECVADAIASLSKTKEIRKEMVKQNALQTVQALADCGSKSARRNCTVAMTKLSTSVKHMENGTVSTLIALCMAPPSDDADEKERMLDESGLRATVDAVTRLPDSLPLPGKVELNDLEESFKQVTFDAAKVISWKKVADGMEGIRPELPDFVNDKSEKTNLMKLRKSAKAVDRNDGGEDASSNHGGSSGLLYNKINELAESINAALVGSDGCGNVLDFSDDEAEDEQKMNLSALSDLYGEQRIIVRSRGSMRGSPRSRSDSVDSPSGSPSNRALKKSLSFVDPTQLEKSMTLPGGKQLPNVI